MRGTPATGGPCAGRARGKTGVVRDVQERHVVADDRTTVERRPFAGGVRIGDLVGALVSRNAAVAADVVPGDPARAVLRLHELLPQVPVQHLPAPGGPPA